MSHYFVSQIFVWKWNSWATHIARTLQLQNRGPTAAAVQVKLCWQHALADLNITTDVVAPGTYQV